MLDLLEEANPIVKEKDDEEETDQDMPPPNQQHKPQERILTCDNIRKKLDFKNLSVPKKNGLPIQASIWLHSYASQMVLLLLLQVLALRSMELSHANPRGNGNL